MPDQAKKLRPKYGLFGGTFDPPHRGHLALAMAAQNELNLQKIFFVPARQNPFKKNTRISAACHRLAMTRCLIEGEKNLVVSPWELRQKGLSYSYKTMAAFQKRHRAEWYLILGGDAFLDFPRWKNWPTLLSQVYLVTGGRRAAGFKNIKDKIMAKTHILEQNIPLVSATDIRQNIHNGKAAWSQLPKKVTNYIQDHGLYS